MSLEELQRILSTLPSGSFAVVVKGRARPVITASIPDGSIPKGWKACAEPSYQHVIGSRRIRWEG